MVLAFALGAIAVLVKSDLRIPDGMYQGMSIYLLFAIGLRGGGELAETPLALVWRPALVTVLLGVATPLWVFAILRWVGRFKGVDAAALAAHYGSVSAVTFTTALLFLEAAGAKAEGFMPALVALLEMPAILVALLLGRRAQTKVASSSVKLGEVVREVVVGKASLLLLGGVAIGWLSGQHGVEQVAPLFLAPFKGVLVLFLLEMGMVAARRFQDFRKAGPFLIGFAVVMPVVHGALGVLLGQAAGLSIGGATVMGTMAASASYIAAPIAVRTALPEANPGYYVTASLAVTFPFNLSLGLPLYFAIAKLAFGGAT
ncbi:MAG: sodium-dependent bicarbonate transport family permease [Myxococcaceae bacterium]|nr:sodium-dependent bicarbonate transport family permease [Myxococcaceae bacterium]